MLFFLGLGRGGGERSGGGGMGGGEWGANDPGSNRGRGGGPKTVRRSNGLCPLKIGLVSRIMYLSSNGSNSSICSVHLSWETNAI